MMMAHDHEYQGPVGSVTCYYSIRNSVIVNDVKKLQDHFSHRLFLSKNAHSHALHNPITSSGYNYL